jgi:ribosomal-protein-alanine N-acetyltransferase
MAWKADNLLVHIRWMIRRDMEEVLDIENRCFEFRWCEEDFIRALRQRNTIGMVAEYDERVMGYMVYELHKRKLTILNFAVDPDHWLRGVGSQMIDKLKGKLSDQRRIRIQLLVRETNTGCCLFLRSQGFQATNVLRGIYQDTDEDAYHFEYKRPQKETILERVLRGEERTLL